MSAEAMQTSAPAPAQMPPAEMLSPAQKAAVIITALPPEDASQLLKQLGDGHVRAYVRATHSLRNIPQVLLERIIIEFIDSLDDSDFTLGPDAASDILSRIMSADAVSNVIGEATGVKRSVWERLGGVSDADLSAFIMREHPRTSAIVVGMLSSEKAAEVIALLDVDTAETVIELLKDLADVDSDILEAIGETIRIELLDKAGTESAAPDEVIGAIFDNLTDRTRDPLMKRLEDKTPDFAKAVAKRMFLFDDIPDRVEARDIPTLTRAIDQKVLEQAIAFSRSRESAATNYILENMSRRLAEQLEETLAEMPALSVSDGEKAEAELIKALRKQVSDGAITLKVKDE